MKITGKRHLTATEKRDIKEIINRGWLVGNTKRKSYKLEKTDAGFTGFVFTKERDDWGKMTQRKQSFTVEIN